MTCAHPKTYHNQQARKLQATLKGCNPKLCPPSVLLTGVKCRATSVAKNPFGFLHSNPQILAERVELTLFIKNMFS